MMLSRSSILIPAQLMMCGICALLLFPNVLPAQSQSANAGNSTLRQSMDAAHRAERAGQLDEAAEHYRDFLAQALDQLAIDHVQLGEYSKATTYFEEALGMAPDSIPIRRDFAVAALQAGDLQRAETLARQGLAHPSPQNGLQARDHQLLGRVLLKMNRFQEARKEMEASIALDPSFEDQYGLAVVCLDMDDEGCATQIFAQLQISFGDTPALHMQIGRAYGNSDFAPRAVGEFRKAIAEDPRLPGAHYSLAAALLSAGENESATREAEAELKKELGISPRDFLTYAALGKLAAASHRNVEAESYLKQAISLNPQNPDAYLYLGQLYVDTNRPVEAETALRQAIQHTSDLARNRYQIQKAHFLLGRILMQQHREDQAHAEMQIAHDLLNKTLSKDKNQLAGMLNGNFGLTSPSTTVTGSATGVSSTTATVDPQTISQQAAFEKQLAPAIADSYNNLGAIAAGKGNYTVAYDNFAHAAAWNPSLDGLDYNMGRAAFSASMFSVALGPLNRYLGAHPQDAGIRAALAMSQFRTEDYTGCLETLRKADKNTLSISQMQYMDAVSMVKTGNLLPGRERLEALEQQHPEIADVHRGLGEVLALQGENRKAIQELRVALHLNANDAETHYDLGLAELVNGETTAAVAELESSIRLQQEVPKYHQKLSEAYKLADRPDDAEKEERTFSTLRDAQAHSAETGAVSSGAKHP